ncbi:twin-arginine translocase subunit TatC [Lysinibacillus sp. FSL K6-0232]|uniref:twin-arginine translocase subunit TatC n=1 Tax=unclassified Lysinibacillus TaxID=2636778 RepID=UPI0030F98A93
MNPKDLTIIEHIEELRKRLFIVAVFFVLAMAGGFFVAKPLVKYIQSTGESYNLELHAFDVVTPLSIYFQIIFLIAFIISSPILMYQLWAFISPGLSEIERKATLSYIPYSFLLFLAGLSFSYFLLFPYVMTFMMNLSNDLEIQQTIGIHEYFTFLFKLTIPFGFLFQLPIVVLFFSRIGILSPDLLIRIRKYSYFALFVCAAIIAPPELASHLMVSVPLFILYEISIMISRIGYKKYLRSEELRLKEEQEAEQKRLVEEALEQQRRQIEEFNQQ